MEQQHRANGRHRVLYEPRKDPVVQQHALELGRHCAGVVLQGVAAVSPNQQDPDGHRVLVASELTKAMLAEVYRMVGAVTGWAVEQQMSASGGPAFGQVVGAAAGTVAPAQRVVQAQPRGVRRASQTARAAARQPSASTQVPRRIIVNRRGF